MQGIYTYVPETNYVPREYSVAAILLLLFMVLISLVSVLNLLYFYISTFRSMCAVPNMTVFCSSLTSCFPGMLLTYFLNDFDIVPVAPIITGITFVFTFYYYYYYYYYYCQSQWPWGLRRRSAAARLLRLWVRIPPWTCPSVVRVVCCQVEVSASGC